MPTITERVLAYLKEQPGTWKEIAKALNIKRRHLRMGYTYYWGNWSFLRAEKAGLIECDDDDRWHLKVEEDEEKEAV